MIASKLLGLTMARYLLATASVCGGPLHVMLHDGNVDHHSVRWCTGFAQECGDLMGVTICVAMNFVPKHLRSTLCDQAWSLAFGSGG
jgi:hypothetical protein